MRNYPAYILINVLKYKILNLKISLCSNKKPDVTLAVMLSVEPITKVYDEPRPANPIHVHQMVLIACMQVIKYHRYIFTGD